MNKELRMVVDLFKFYVIKITKNKSYKFKNSDAKEKQILNFIERLKKLSTQSQLGEGYLTDYFEYNFNYWYRIERGLVKGKEIQIGWIIGPKALSRWFKRSDKQKRATGYFVRKGLKKDIKIVNKIFDNQKSEYEELLIDINNVEENEKERFLNTRKGFANCTISTTLFNHKSKHCSICKFSVDCKEFLKNNMPTVYKLRKY